MIGRVELEALPDIEVEKGVSKKLACKHVNILVSASSHFVNSKGGLGKSTIAVHYAVPEREKGRRVALIDSDVQESSTR